MTTTAPVTTRAFGVDLITFFDPAFYGVSSREELESLAAAEPRQVWDRILDALQEAGIAEFEMTFAPADRLTAIAAFGSAEAFAAEVAARGLSVVSAYFADIEHADDVTDPTTREAILAAAETESAFLAQLGAAYLVAGLPMRRNNAQGDNLAPVDLATALPIADIANEVGAITARHGVTLALHTESHSVFWTPRDVDLFLLLTDPFLVAFCPDTGHIVLGGGDPVQLVSRHRERVVIAHWKDAAGAFREKALVDGDIFDRHRPYFRAAGQGIVDWPAFARTLAEIGYEGGILLELDAASDPVGQLIAARTYLEDTTAGIL
ncbi:sugar phosphate isomerase/epimerase [Leifsonia shinshuensis]|uniref:sugar phosphate isomerase/epimerase family protein n=1 Tax=Leifsonia shinshuensis TaxID=150026 RepID=UPI001F5072C7|nr:sugar phosphate isomerase/epimerase [Leifsonia shinshuensis]MCI0158375.1 sugar phosphate isomerase/epimerase [Leifsonia shinshuensis]